MAEEANERPGMGRVSLVYRGIGTDSPVELSDEAGEFEAALRLAPSFSAARYGLGVVLALAGHTQEAIRELEACLQAADPLWSGSARERLRQVRGET